MTVTKKKMTKKKQKAVSVVAYKGFDKNLQCKGFQFEIGQSYSTDGEIVICERGFHACENPLDVWGYYAPSDSRFALVELSGDTARHSGDTKIVAAEITIKAEISLPEFIKRSVDYLLAHVVWKGAKKTNTGDWSAATNTGDQSAATNTGDQSAATNTGDQSAATNTGNRSAATNTGNQSAATAGGKDSVALASGFQGMVSGANGNALFLVERDEDLKIIEAWAGIVGRDGIKPDTFYTLKNGSPVEAGA